MLQQINRGELEKTIYCMTSLTQNVQIRQIYILQKIDLFCIGLVGIQAGFRKGRGTRDHIASICWIMEKAREFQKNIYFCFIDYAKAFDFVDLNKLENSQRDGNTRPPDPPLEKPICRSATVRTGHEPTDWFQIGKGVRQGCILSPCLFNFYTEYIMRNAGLQ